MVYKWRTNPEIIARLVDTSSFSSLRSQDIVLESTETLVIVQDGKIVDTYTEQRINKAVGGIRAKLFSRGKVAEKFIFSITSPFKIHLEFQCVSLDGMEVKGATSIELQIHQTDATKLVNLFTNIPQNPLEKGPGAHLTRSSLSNMLSSKILHKVLQAEIGTHNLGDIRTSSEIQMKIKDNLLNELRREFSEYGLTFRENLIIFNPNAHDKVQRLRGELNLQRSVSQIDQDAKIFVLEDKFQLIHKELELQSQSQLLMAKGDDSIEIQHHLAQLEIQQATFDQHYDQNIRLKVQEISDKRAEMELQQELADRDLERRFQSGDTTAQEREFILKQQQIMQDLQSSQLDKSREMKEGQLDKTQITSENQVELMQQAMKAISSGKQGSAEIAGMLETMMQQQSITQRTNMEQETLQQKELLKQQTAQKFFESAGKAQGDVTFVQGDLVGSQNGDPRTHGGKTPILHPPKNCNICGSQARFIGQYKRFYCDNCKTYL